MFNPQDWLQQNQYNVMAAAAASQGGQNSAAYQQHYANYAAVAAASMQAQTNPQQYYQQQNPAALQYAAQHMAHQQRHASPKPLVVSKKEEAKPKGKMSAYAFFVKAERERIKVKDPNGSVNFKEFSKACSTKWNGLVIEDKDPYKEMAEKDKQRYKNEIELLGGKVKSRKKDPDAPKRAQSAFFVFAGDYRPKLRETHPEWSVAKLSTELGAMWRNMTSDDKKPFEAKANIDKSRYQKAKEDYEKTKGKRPKSRPAVITDVARKAAQSAQSAANIGMGQSVAPVSQQALGVSQAGTGMMPQQQIQSSNMDRSPMRQDAPGIQQSSELQAAMHLQQQSALHHQQQHNAMLQQREAQQAQQSSMQHHMQSNVHQQNNSPVQGNHSGGEESSPQHPNMMGSVMPQTSMNMIPGMFHPSTTLNNNPYNLGISGAMGSSPVGTFGTAILPGALNMPPSTLGLAHSLGMMPGSMVMPPTSMGMSSMMSKMGHMQASSMRMSHMRHGATESDDEVDGDDELDDDDDDAEGCDE